jgi:hypothetical protein
MAAAEDLRQGADGKQEARPRRNPAPAFRREGAASDDAVDVEVLREGLPPGMQDGGHPHLTAEMPRVAAEAGERGGGGLKQQSVDQARVALRQRVEGVGYVARLAQKHGKGKALTLLAHKLARAVY